MEDPRIILKIIVADNKEYIAVQKSLFRLGYSWINTGKSIAKTEAFVAAAVIVKSNFKLYTTANFEKDNKTVSYNSMDNFVELQLRIQEFKKSKVN
jgi:hypothetical protein